jgi:DNA-binding NarL/FixJ family response regulator
LTKREKEILDLLVAGETQKMIAGKLSLSAHTIGTHIKNIYAKLQVHSRGEVVAKALEENLL